MKKCPFCGEEIMEVAIKCKHCGERLEPVPPPAAETLGQASPAEGEEPSRRVEPDSRILFSLSNAQLVCIGICSGILAGVLFAAAVYFSNKGIEKTERQPASHVSSSLPDTAGGKKCADSVISHEEPVQADSGRMAFIEKLNAVISRGTACGTALAKANLQDLNAEIEELRDRPVEARKRIEAVKGDFEKLSAFDTLFHEQLAMIRDGLKLLAEAARYYNRYYYAESTEEETKCKRSMLQKAAAANELLRKAGAGILPSASRDAGDIARSNSTAPDSGRSACAKKLKDIIAKGMDFGGTMVNADLQDPNAEIEQLQNAAAETRRNIEALAAEFGQLPPADTACQEAHDLIRDGLQLLTEAARNYFQYYYAENEDEEAQRGRAMRHKAAGANELFRKADTGLVKTFSCR